ncbi:MAG: hypothetical protein JNN18_20260 [Rubrivivax sp.]|nr:hypothetical protein [Rubrivivax sp.]
MSVDKDQLPASQDHDDWVLKNLGFKTKRSEHAALRVDKSLERSLGVVEEGDQGSEKTRESLRRRLQALRKTAVSFASVSPPDWGAQVRDDLDVVEKKLRGKDWKDAHIGLNKLDKYMQERMREVRELNKAQDRTAELVQIVDRLKPDTGAEEHKALREKLQRLREALRPDNHEKAKELLESFDLEVTAKAEEVQKKLTRIEQLQRERGELVDLLKSLVERAKGCELDEKLQLAIGGAHGDLVLLADSKDEDALKRAVEPARDACEKTWAPAVQSREEQKELESQRARLKELATERDLLIKANETGKAAALEVYRDEIDLYLRELNELLGASDKPDVVAAEAKLKELEREYKYVSDEMERVGRLRTRVKRILEDYLEVAAKPPANKAWQQLAEAYSDLPDAMSVPTAETFETANAWAYEDDGYVAVEAFIRLYSIFKGKSDNAAREAAYEDAIKRRGELEDSYRKVARFATDEPAKKCKEAFDNADKHLKGNKAERLTEKQESEVKEELDKIPKLIKQIEQHREDGRNKAAMKDVVDGGHSIARHGPDIDDTKLKNRLSSGKAPDGVFSPTQRSSRFLNYDEWEKTRVAAFEQAQKDERMDFGKNLDNPPRQGEPTTIVVDTLDHGRKIGDGFKGKPPGTFKAHPSGNGGGMVYATFDELPSLTKTKTTIEWDTGKQRWVAAQHFPTE